MTQSGSDLWLGRSDLSWNILLVASSRDPVDAGVLRERLAALFAREGWPAAADGSLVEGQLPELLGTLAETRDPEHPVSAGRTPDGVVVRGHHAHVDGLGLLAVVRDLVAADLRSSATGVSARERRSTSSTIASRMLELVARPPVGVGRSRGYRPGNGDEGDVFATCIVDRHARTAALAHAAVQAICAHNEARGVRGRRVALAVGVSVVGGQELRVGDDSGFLRLTDAERLDAQAMDRALARAPLQVGGTARTGTARRAGGLIRWASRVLSSRLGSTLLVSHLGRVQASGLVDLAFYPLAGNGSGVSLGAATVGERTTLTLRARGSQHDASELEELLDAIAARLS